MNRKSERAVSLTGCFFFSLYSSRQAHSLNFLPPPLLRRLDKPARAPQPDMPDTAEVTGSVGTLDDVAVAAANHKRPQSAVTLRCLQSQSVSVCVSTHPGTPAVSLPLYRSSVDINNWKSINLLYAHFLIPNYCFIYI